MRNITIALLAGLAMGMAASAGADGLSRVKITFQTLACDGSTGMASVEADRIAKANAIPCAPDAAVKEVYQLLVRSGTGTAMQYEVYSVDKLQLDNITRQLDAYQDDKRKSLREGKRIIIR